MRALILSSFVAADPIGGGAQQLRLAALGFETCLIPTVVFGRSPPKGGHGRATDPEHFAGMLADAQAEGWFAAELVLTGHFSHPAQVEAAAEAIREMPRPLVVVDPILGDEGRGLYVKPEVADALEALLLPLAAWITPNAWELAHLTGLAVTDAASARHAAHQLEPSALVTSVPIPDERFGLLCSDAADTLITHRRTPSAPNGTGDLVAAVFAAHLAQGSPPAEAAEAAALAVVEWLRLEGGVSVEPMA